MIKLNVSLHLSLQLAQPQRRTAETYKRLAGGAEWQPWWVSFNQFSLITKKPKHGTQYFKFNTDLLQMCHNVTLVFSAPMCWREMRRICHIRMSQTGLLVNWAGRRPRRCFKEKLLEHSWSVKAASRDATPALLCEYNSLESSVDSGSVLRWLSFMTH